MMLSKPEQIPLKPPRHRFGRGGYPEAIRIYDFWAVSGMILEHHGTSWNIMDILKYHGISWNILEKHEISWNITEHP